MPNVKGKYERRSVDDIENFDGWDSIVSLYERLKSEAPEGIAEVFNASFLTGGRITETLNLRKSMVTSRQVKSTINEIVEGKLVEKIIVKDYFHIQGMMLEKRYAKEGDKYQEFAIERKGQGSNEYRPEDLTEEYFVYDTCPEIGSVARLWHKLSPPLKLPSDTMVYFARNRLRTKSLAKTRFNFMIPKKEFPENSILHDDFQKYLDSVNDWLFYSRTKKGALFSRSYIWTQFKEFGIHPHWTRAQRASCMAVYHGMRLEQFMRWFTWSEVETALHYIRMNAEDQASFFR